MRDIINICIIIIVAFVLYCVSQVPDDSVVRDNITRYYKINEKST